MEEACCVHEGDARDRRLEKLGITEEVITTAVEAGEAEARQCTENDAPMARGLYRYLRTVRVLRDGTATKGWGRDNPRNFARAVSPERQSAIAPAFGDERTGDPKLQPSTKYHKGTMVMEAVGANVQLELFEVPETHTATVASPSIATWILLYHVAEDEIRYELSLPIETIGGYISGWRERIIFPPLARSPQTGLVAPQEEFAPDIDILVARR